MLKLSNKFKNQRFIASIQIEPDNISLSKKDKDILKHIHFNIKTYSNVKKSFELLQPINSFINTLSKKDQFNIFYIYRDIKILESNMELSLQDNVLTKDMTDNEFSKFSDNILILTKEIDKLLLNRFNEIDLITKIKKYVSENISFPNLKNIGKRAQDNADTTFYKEDYFELTCLSMICKLLCPIFGEIIGLFNNSYNLDKTLKEINAIRITKSIVNQHFNRIKEKLLLYIDSRIKLHTTKTNDINSILKGFDRYKLNLYIYSIIIVKKLININLFNPTQNIMIYIHRCIINTITSQLDSLRKYDKYMIRFTESYAGTEEDNDLLEYECGKYTYNINKYILIEKSAEYVIETLINKFKINRTDYEQSYKFYYNNKFKPTIITEIILSCIIGKYLYNGSAIKYINIKQVSQLIAITQLIIVNYYKEDYEDIIHVISVLDTDTYKTKKSLEDYKIIGTKGNEPIYTDIINNLNIYFKYVEFELILDNIIKIITAKKLIFNTADTIWKLLNISEKNYLDFTYKQDIVHKIFYFIEIIKKEF